VVPWKGNHDAVHFSGCLKEHTKENLDFLTAFSIGKDDYAIEIDRGLFIDIFKNGRRIGV
jgi:hypothetical protein